jgi:hypothetical protein
MAVVRGLVYAEAAPVREYAQSLLAQGFKQQQIATAASVDVGWVRWLLHGRNGQLPKRVQACHAQAILAIKLGRLADAEPGAWPDWLYVKAAPVRQHAARLRHRGMSLQVLAVEIAVTPSRLSRALFHGAAQGLAPQWVEAALAAAVLTVQFRPPEPYYVEATPVRQHVQWLLEQGMMLRQIAAQAGEETQQLECLAYGSSRRIKRQRAKALLAVRLELPMSQSQPADESRKPAKAGTAQERARALLAQIQQHHADGATLGEAAAAMELSLAAVRLRAAALGIVFPERHMKAAS